MTQNVKPLLFQTYMAVIKNSVGSKMFRNFYAEIDGVKKDIMNEGNISCAFFVSNILYMFPKLKLISSPHATVTSTVKDMLENGWQESEIKIGSVLHWEAGFGPSGTHEHLGFYIGDNLAISHSDKEKSPAIHNINFDNTRKITHIYSHKNLEVL